jgi:hypothetical protein
LSKLPKVDDQTPPGHSGGSPKPRGVTFEEIPSRMISADGRHIAFTGRTTKQELWLVRNLLTAKN